MASQSSVRVIDIGSNTIKVLVADVRGGKVFPLHEQTEEVRISAGNSDQQGIALAALEAATAAVARLLDGSEAFSPRCTVCVATSAVRDAPNCADVAARLRDATGLELQILTGEEEARGIARGVCADPDLNAEDCRILDMGGGSLEFIEVKGREAAIVKSFPLGAVRLTRMLSSTEGVIDEQIRMQWVAMTRDSLQASVHPSDCPLVGCGGAFTVARWILGGCRTLTLRSDSLHGSPNAVLHSSPRVLSLERLETLADELCKLPLEQRMEIYGVPQSRADIMPAALVVLTEACRVAACKEVFHSFYNLRYGIALEVSAHYPR